MAKSKSKKKSKSGFHPNLPLRKPTVEEKEARIDYFMDLLAESPNLSEHKLRSIAWRKWKVVPSTSDRYASEAKEKLRTALNMSRVEIRAEAVNFYRSIISNPMQKTSDRLKAQENLCRLLGVEAPTKVEVSGPGGVPLTPVSTQEVLDTMTVDQLEVLVDKLTKALPAPVDVESSVVPG